MLKIAERWFERRVLGGGITHLIEPHVHPFLRCNIWHIRGRHADLLIDTGLGVASLKDEIEDLVDKPVIAAATHIHSTERKRSRDKRMFGKVDKDKNGLLDYHEFAWLRMRDFPSEYQSELIMDGFDEALVNAAPDAAFRLDDYFVQSTTVTRVLDEADVVDLGNRHFEVLHLPGHSPGSIGLFEHETGTLFSGDALYDGLLLDQLPDSDIEAYINTMKRLRDLPVNICHGGHEPSFGRKRMIELIDDYLAHRDP